jgi:hypothetical protein
MKWLPERHSGGIHKPIASTPGRYIVSHDLQKIEWFVGDHWWESVATAGPYRAVVRDIPTAAAWPGDWEPPEDDEYGQVGWRVLDTRTGKSLGGEHGWSPAAGGNFTAAEAKAAAEAKLRNLNP